ncbi:conserved hypothetical protein [Neorickettsia risticii str. Illinois]|uniref:Macro domain-containing protein n=1 Tax=Neorickettsia risticii (strain Illinois) TaxID=434131 RepID=C6V3Z2_NEORI|nr:hypothetical protein [Neorickettsia risticii]ACT69109.1 conserved hypothetical protein [Neorickettsia risticii str. Illinois]
MGTNEKIWIACGVVGFLLLLALAAGLYWLCKARARRAVESTLEDVRVTGLVPGMEGVLFSSDELLGPAGATEPTWDSDVVILDTSSGALGRECYSEDNELYRVLGIAGREIDEDVRKNVGRSSFVCGPKGCTSAGYKWSLVHVCPPGLHNPSGFTDPRDEVYEAVSEAAQSLFSYSLLRHVDEIVNTREADRGLTILIQVPFSEPHGEVVSKHGQAKIFAECFAVIGTPAVRERLGARVKVCCGDEETRGICAEAVFRVNRDAQAR